MIFAFLSSRVRQWLLLALVLPLAGRLLDALGVRLAGRAPRVGRALSTAGRAARRPGRGRRR